MPATTQDAAAWPGTDRGEAHHEPIKNEHCINIQCSPRVWLKIAFRHTPYAAALCSGQARSHVSHALELSAFDIEIPLFDAAFRLDGMAAVMDQVHGVGYFVSHP